MAKALQLNLLGILLGCGLISSFSAWLVFVVQNGNTNMAYVSCFLAGVLIVGLGISKIVPLLNRVTYFLVFLVCIGGLTMAFFVKTILKDEQKIRNEIINIPSVSQIQHYDPKGYFTIQEKYKFLPEKSVFAQQEDLYFFLIPVVSQNWQPNEEISLFTSFKVRKPHQMVDWRKTQTEYLKNLTVEGTVARFLKNDKDLYFSKQALADFPATWCKTDKHFLVEMGEVRHPIGYENGLKIGFLLLNGLWLAVSVFYLLKVPEMS